MSDSIASRRRLCRMLRASSCFAWPLSRAIATSRSISSSSDHSAAASARSQAFTEWHAESLKGAGVVGTVSLRGLAAAVRRRPAFAPLFLCRLGPVSLTSLAVSRIAVCLSLASARCTFSWPGLSSSHRSRPLLRPALVFHLSGSFAWAMNAISSSGDARNPNTIHGICSSSATQPRSSGTGSIACIPASGGVRT